MQSANGQTSSKKYRRFDKRVIISVAPVNIATIKYWGKADEASVLPLNNSISVTLDTTQLCTETTISAFRKQGDGDETEDIMFLNGRHSKITSRIAVVLSKMREAARHCGSELADWRLYIETINNFPTAAGLASSASGLACLVFGLKNLFNLIGDFSHIARLGSGSACRSMLGGFVEWTRITDVVNSGAEQIADANHWPELKVLICVGNDEKKACGSTDGMQNSVRTSKLLQARIRDVLPERLTAMRRAIRDRDFEIFAQTTMQESNQLHAICLDTFPPLVYLAPCSFLIMRIVHAMNELAGRSVAAYTCDAGAHVFLFILEKDVPMVLRTLRAAFTMEKGEKESPVPVQGWDVDSIGALQKSDYEPPKPPMKNGLTRIICTNVGSGPTMISTIDT